MTGALAAVLLALAAGPAPKLRVPSEIVLGTTTPTSTVFLDGDAGANVRLVVSVGSLSALAPQSGGGLQAEYQPPLGKAPGVAIVAALAEDGTLLDWSSIRLLGQAKVITRSKPNAQVRVRVGEKEYGPERADKQGAHEFAVVIPPGTKTALTLAEDQLGATKETVVALDPPPFNRLLALCPEAGRDVLRVLVVGSSGDPANDADLLATQSTGALSAPTKHAPGVFELRFDPATARNALATVEVSLADDGISTAHCEITVAPENPSSVEVTLDPPSYVAGSGTPVVVRVDVRYPGFRDRAEVPVTLRASAGTIGAAIGLAAAGPVTAEWTFPDSVKTRHPATVVVHAGSLTKEIALVLHRKPAPPRVVAVTAKAGWTSNLGRLSTPAASVDASVRLRRVSPSLAVGFEGGWFTSNARARTRSGAPVNMHVSAFPLLARATWDVLSQPVYVGALAGVYLADTRLSSPTSATSTSFLAHRALGVVAGAELPLGAAPGRIGLELSWRDVPLAAGPLSGQLGGLGVSALYRHEF